MTKNELLENENYKLKLTIITNCILLLALMCNGKVRRRTKKQIIKRNYITFCLDDVSVYF